MKKTILVSLTIVSLFMTGCGCGKKLEKKVCKMKEIEENYELNSTITLEYDTKNNKMLSFEENSALTSDKQEIYSY